MRQIRRQADRQWLNACIGVVDNNYIAVEEYLACGGSPARALNSNEVLLLNRSSAFDVGHTLIHLYVLRSLLVSFCFLLIVLLIQCYKISP